MYGISRQCRLYVCVCVKSEYILVEMLRASSIASIRTWKNGRPDTKGRPSFRSLPRNCLIAWSAGYTHTIGPTNLGKPCVAYVTVNLNFRLGPRQLIVQGLRLIIIKVLNHVQFDININWTIYPVGMVRKGIEKVCRASSISIVLERVLWAKCPGAFHLSRNGITFSEIKNLCPEAIHIQGRYDCNYSIPNLCTATRLLFMLLSLESYWIDVVYSLLETWFIRYSVVGYIRIHMVV